MSLTTVFFDLDGTHLPMDEDIFVKAYFKGLALKLAPYGYVPETLTRPRDSVQRMKLSEYFLFHKSVIESAGVYQIGWNLITERG